MPENSLNINFQKETQIEIVESYLYEILSFCFGDQWLEFGCCEGINQTGLGDDKQQNLSASQYGKFVGLDELIKEG